MVSTSLDAAEAFGRVAAFVGVRRCPSLIVRMLTACAGGFGGADFDDCAGIRGINEFGDVGSCHDALGALAGLGRGFGSSALGAPAGFGVGFGRAALGGCACISAAVGLLFASQPVYSV